MKLFVIGDSLAKGILYDEADGRYRALDGGPVFQFARQLGWQVKNLGMFGATIERVNTILTRHEKEIDASSVVVIECGGNDSDFDWASIAQDPAAPHAPMTTLERFAQEYEKLIARVRALGAVPVLVNLPPIEEKRYFFWISRGKNAQNILKWLGGSEQYIYRWHEMYNMCVCTVAAKCNAALADVRSLFLQQRDYGQLLCADGIHPNEAGYRLIYSAVAPYLR